MKGYTPKERRIYKWHDGQKWRVADPMAIERSMSRQLGANWEELHVPMRKYAEFAAAHAAAARVAAAREESQEPSEADLKAAAFDPGPALWNDLSQKCQDSAEKLAAATRVAFNLPELTIDEAGDVTGWEERQLLDLLTDWVIYMRGLAAAAAPLPQRPLNLDSAATVPPMQNGVASTPIVASA
jgi:hypothetical protein